MMIDEGLEAEARSVYHLRHLNSLQTVGYREMFDYFDGTTTREEAIELIKRNSRRYAKRQLTWFRRDTATGWFNPADLPAIIEFIDSHK
jgi:tRNA dimethylallyltransferase